MVTFSTVVTREFFRVELLVLHGLQGRENMLATLVPICTKHTCLSCSNHRFLTGTRKQTVAEHSTVCCAQLQTEIKIHRSIAHRHVVKFHDVFEDKDNVYILMEV